MASFELVPKFPANPVTASTAPILMGSAARACHTPVPSRSDKDRPMTLVTFIKRFISTDIPPFFRLCVHCIGPQSHHPVSPEAPFLKTSLVFLLTVESIRDRSQ